MINLVKSRMNIIDVQQLKVVFSSRHHYYITADYKKYAFKIQKHFWSGLRFFGILTMVKIIKIQLTALLLNASGRGTMAIL